MDDETISIGNKVYWTEAGLARAIRKSRRTVRRWGAAGKGPPRHMLGNTPIFDVEEIPGWIARLGARSGEAA